MTIVFIALLIIALFGCWYGWWRNRKLTRCINRILDEVLSDIPVSQSDIKEGEISALASKAKQIQDKVDHSVVQAEIEKEAVKQLISNMSHQLKTPLANVMMYQEMLENESVDETKRHIFLQKMKKQTNKLDWILNALFKMVELEQGAVVFDSQPLAIRATLAEAVGATLDKAEAKKIKISVEPFVDCFLYHNRKWTTEVFVNLIENAIKYTPVGGQITITVEPFEFYSAIHITDNGIGIRSEEHAAIFQRFYRGKDVENIEGSGIGLTLSRMILENEKGYITVDSEPGKGSTFSVFLQNCHK